MRTALLLGTLGLAGCLSAPTGLPRDAGGDAIDAGADAEPEHVWPPTGDVDFRAIASGDLGGDAADDLILVNAGTQHTGVFLLITGVDVDPEAATLATTYAEYHRIDSLAPPVAAGVFGDHVVILDNPVGGARITVLDDSLNQVAQYDTGGPVAPMMSRPSLRRIGLGTGGSIAIINGDDLRLLDLGMIEDDAPTFIAPPPPVSNWASVQVLDVYVDGMPTFLAGLAITSYTSLVPTGGGGQTWTQERNGTAWTSQVTGTVPVDGVDDGKADLVGFDPIGGICMLDAVANTQPSCLVVPVPQDNGIELLYGDYGNDPDDDLVIMVPTGVAVEFNALPKLRVAAGGLASDPAPASASTPGANARVTGADLDTAAGPRVIVQVAADGALACTTVRPAGIQPCAP